MKRHLPIKERKLYYNAIIKQVMMYGNTIWSPSSFGKLERVYKLQKRAARIILNADTKERSAKLFKELNWLPLQDEIKVQKGCIIYKRINGESPSYME